MNYIEHKAITFRNKTKLSAKTLTFSDLNLAANKIGYIVKPYSTTAAMMIAMGLYDEARNAASVSIKDKYGNIIIFVDDSLTQDKQLFALAHEIGHIYLGHNSKTPKSIQEDEANKFANYILNNVMKSSFSKTHIIPLLLIVLTLCAVLIISPFAFKESSISAGATAQVENIDLDATATYYWTESGRVFHYYRSCQALKNSSDILCGDLSEAQHEKDRLCKFCEKKLK